MFQILPVGERKLQAWWLELPRQKNDSNFWNHFFCFFHPSWWVPSKISNQILLHWRFVQEAIFQSARNLSRPRAFLLFLAFLCEYVMKGQHREGLCVNRCVMAASSPDPCCQHLHPWKTGNKGDGGWASSEDSFPPSCLILYSTGTKGQETESVLFPSSHRSFSHSCNLCSYQ